MWRIWFKSLLWSVFMVQLKLTWNIWNCSISIFWQRHIFCGPLVSLSHRVDLGYVPFLVWSWKINNCWGSICHLPFFLSLQEAFYWIRVSAWLCAVHVQWFNLPNMHWQLLECHFLTRFTKAGRLWTYFNKPIKSLGSRLICYM